MLKKTLAGALAAVIILGGVGWFYVDHRIRSEFDARLQAAVDNGSYEALYYDELSYTFNGDVSIKNLHVKQYGTEFVLQQFQINNLDISEQIPRDIRVHISGMQFPDGLPDLSDTDSAALGQLLQRSIQGDTIPLELTYVHKYDPENDFQLDSSVMASIPELMNIEFSSSMKKISLETLADYNQSIADPMAAQLELMQMLSKGEFSSMTFSLQDTGLVQGYMEITAEDFAVAPEDYRNMLVTQARNLYLFLPQNAQGLAMNAGIQLAAFLEGGKTLTVKLQPQFNGSIEKLQPQIMGAALTGDYNRIVELLQFELTAH